MKPDIDYWTSTEASVWRDFLQTETGKKLLRFLAEQEPTLLSNGDTNSILIRSGEAKHHKEILSSLLELTGGIEILDNIIEDNFPALNDDSKWEGPKLNEPE